MEFDSSNNILIGAVVDVSATDYGNNVVIGHEALSFPSGGVYDNVLIGKFVGNTANNARQNTIIGTYAAGNIHAGQQNVCIGTGAGYELKDSDYNLFVGFESGYMSSGNQNMFLGPRSGYESQNSDNNVFIGSHAGANNISSSDNVFVGNSAGKHNHAGTQNVFVGAHSGFQSNAGSHSVFVGYESGRDNKGSDNVMIGMESGLTANVAQSILVGYGAGANAIGSENVLVGYQSASNITGSTNVVVGSNSNVQVSNNSVILGSNVTVTNASSIVAIGSDNVILKNLANVVLIGRLPYTESGGIKATLMDDSVYLSTPANIVMEANSSLARFPGNVHVNGRITFSGLTVDYNDLLNKPTDLSSFTNNITVAWANVINVPQNITSVDALSTNNRVLYYASNAVQTATTLAWNASSQRLGVGVADPRYSVDVSGYVRSTQGYLLESDERKKTNLQKIGNAIERIQSIHGYTYEYTDYPGTREAGVVAQDVAGVLAEAVASEPTTGIMSVKYDALVALLVEAIKELDLRTRQPPRDS